MKRILVTGAAGLVANLVIPDLQKEYELYLTDQREPKQALERFTLAKLEDFDAMSALCQGMDAVIHLGALGMNQANWENLIAPNVIGVQNILLAARAAGCKRVILASSVQTTIGHTHQPILETDPMYPINFYGATKVFAEALGRVHSHDGGLSVICLRLGAILKDNDLRVRPGHADMPLAISKQDLCQLLRLSLETKLLFGVFNGVSNNQPARFDLEITRQQLGFRPQDDMPALARNNKLNEIRWFAARVKSFLKRRLAR